MSTRKLPPVYLAVLTCWPAGCAEEPSPHVRTCIDHASTTPRPDYPLIRQTEHLDIYVSEDLTVCAGTAAEMERHVTFIADTLGFEIRQRIPLYLSYAWPRECGSGWIMGCSFDDGVTFSVPTATYHELGHAVACQLRNNSIPALSEGLADLFRPYPHQRLHNDMNLRESLGGSHGERGKWHDEGVIFMRWLIDSFGGESVADVYVRVPAPRGGYKGDVDAEGVISVFEDVYGMDFDELEREFVETTPWEYMPYHQCDDIPHVERDLGAGWRYLSVMDCDSDDTFGPYERVPQVDRLIFNGGRMMHQSFTIDVESLDDYEVDLEGAEFVHFERCSTEHAASEDEARDLFAVRTTWRSPPWDKVKLHPGTWRLDVLRDLGPAAPFEVIVRPFEEDD